MISSLRRLLAALALTLYAALAVASIARADGRGQPSGPSVDVAPPKDDPDKGGGCLASGLPWALPPIGLGIAFVVRHRARTRNQGSPE